MAASFAILLKTNYFTGTFQVFGPKLQQLVFKNNYVQGAYSSDLFSDGLLINHSLQCFQYSLLICLNE